jgi:hypothetical protein
MKALEKKFKENKFLKTNSEYFKPANLVLKLKPFNGAASFISRDYICCECSEVVKYPYHEHFYDCKRDKPNSNIITFLMGGCVEI